MYDKEIYKRDVTCSWPPVPPVTNCHTFSDPSPSSVTHFMNGPLGLKYWELSRNMKEFQEMFRRFCTNRPILVY